MTAWLRPSSNWTGGFPASGFPRAMHSPNFYARATVHAARVGSRPSQGRSRRTACERFAHKTFAPSCLGHNQWRSRSVGYRFVRSKTRVRLA